MHMADALLSPAVGGTLWAVSAAGIAYCARKVRDDLDERKVPLMGVLGAFLFAAQMINFSIPGTGSSGHLGGGLLLAILLGPHAAFLTVASVLVVQALFFADGGLLALGCNIFNLGFFPAFVAYPLVYQRIAGARPSPARLSVATIVAAVVGLQLGAFGVVANATVQNAENRDTGLDLLRRPGQKGTLRVDYHFAGGASLGSEVFGSGTRQDFNGPLPGYGLVHLVGSLPFGERWRLGIRVEPPSINRSGVAFDVTGDTIHYALSALKGVGTQAVARAPADGHTWLAGSTVATPASTPSTMP